MSNKNVAIFTNMYPSVNDEPWMGIFVKEQADALSKIYDGKIHVYHIKGGMSKGGNNYNYLLWVFKLPLLLLKHKIKIIHSHHLFCTIIACLYPFTKIIYTVHEGELQVGGIRAWLIRLAIKFSDHIIFVNKEMYDQLQLKNSTFQPCGIDLAKFSPADKFKSRENVFLSTLADKKYIFFPASPNRLEKNSFFLKSFIEHEKEFVDKLNIEIIWGGSISYDDMPIYMNAVNLLVSFSDFESDGMVFKEAMSCNLPVITFDVGNADLYFGDKESGSVIEKNNISLKNEILYWLTHDSLGRSKIFELGMSSTDVSHVIVDIYITKV